MPFYWWLRLRKNPLGIKLAVAVFGLQTAAWTIIFLHHILALTWASLPGAMAQAALGVYGVVATSRLGRWPLAIMVSAYGIGFVAVHLGVPQSPAELFWGLVETGLIAFFAFPHWRRMNWLPFGEEPPDEPRIEDHFS